MSASLVRSQIQFTRSQLARIRDLANAADVSVAEVVRRAVDYYVDRQVAAGGERPARLKAVNVAGRYSSGRVDVSERHDDHLSDAFRT